MGIIGIIPIATWMVVQLDAEAWDRLITWIDLNCPYHGPWGEELANPGVQRDRRRELLKLYANVDDDPEAVSEIVRPPVEPVPAGLHWDEWIGPAAYREYHADLHPALWRSWWEFGDGAISAGMATAEKGYQDTSGECPP